ncbi:MAG: helix-turn-helix domain-containing protein [Hespellia sp.]|nr:helix-turn-helix domain-containing protein [Hespellia sp.]
MASRNELEKAIKELTKATGLHMQITAETPEETEYALMQVKQLLGAYKEKFDKNYFLRSLMLGRLQTTEIDAYAKKLHISNETKRVLFLIETKNVVDDLFIELLKNMFPSQGKNYVVKMDHHRVVLLGPTEETGDTRYAESMSIAHMIVDTVGAEAMSSVHVSFSREMNELSDALECYRDAMMSMRIRNIFYSEQLIMPYDRLGTGGLLIQVPQNNCEEFLREVFRGELPEQLDEEMQLTISKFFQYNLNIAETSRQLHMHRNTLIYRIEQLEKKTGLDIRVFEDACVIRIAMMAMNYLNVLREKK